MSKWNSYVGQSVLYRLWTWVTTVWSNDPACQELGPTQTHFKVFFGNKEDIDSIWSIKSKNLCIRPVHVKGILYCSWYMTFLFPELLILFYKVFCKVKKNAMLLCLLTVIKMAAERYMPHHVVPYYYYYEYWCFYYNIYIRPYWLNAWHYGNSKKARAIIFSLYLYFYLFSSKCSFVTLHVIIMLV